MISLERRDRPSPWASIAVPAVSIATAFVAGAVVLWYAGVDPLAAYAEVLSQAFGSGFGLAETAVKAIPLIFTGLAVLLPARMKLWNIGAEGQLQLGAIGAAWVALWTPLGHSAVAGPAIVARAQQRVIKMASLRLIHSIAPQDCSHPWRSTFEL